MRKIIALFLFSSLSASLNSGCRRERITPEIAFNHYGTWGVGNKKFIFDFVAGQNSDEEHYQFFENDSLIYDLVNKRYVEQNVNKLTKVVETREGLYLRFKLNYDRPGDNDTLEITGPVSDYKTLSPAPTEKYSRR